MVLAASYYLLVAAMAMHVLWSPDSKLWQLLSHALNALCCIQLVFLQVAELLSEQRMGGSRDVSPTGRGGSPTAAAAAAAAAGAVKALSDEQAAEQDQEEVRIMWAHVRVFNAAVAHLLGRPSCAIKQRSKMASKLV